MGTSGYFSEEMEKCMFGEVNMVDLYYNDVHGLKKSLNEIEDVRKKRNKGGK